MRLDLLKVRHETHEEWIDLYSMFGCIKKGHGKRSTCGATTMYPWEDMNLKTSVYQEFWQPVPWWNKMTGHVPFSSGLTINKDLGGEQLEAVPTSECIGWNFPVLKTPETEWSASDASVGKTGLDSSSAVANNAAKRNTKRVSIFFQCLRFREVWQNVDWSLPVIEVFPRQKDWVLTSLCIHLVK
jgi:hypothetical protein